MGPLLLASSLLGLAFGQAAPLSLEGVPPAPAAQAPPSLASTTQWTDVGPVGGGGFVDVAIHPLRAGIWVVADRTGAVWLTTDGGGGWVVILDGERNRFGATSTDEDVLLDVAARIDEMAEGSEADTTGFSDPDAAASDDLVDEVADDVASVAGDVAAGIQGELDQGLWFDDTTGRSASGRTRVRFSAAGHLLVARPDGLHVSVDLGATWFDPLGVPIADVVEWDGRFVATGPSGLFVSTDLQRWSMAAVPMPQPPSNLVVDGGLWATGPSGVWRADAAGWRALPHSVAAPLTVRPASADLAALVVGGQRAAFRASPYDAPPDPAIGGPITVVRDVERVRDGFLLAASADGPFESNDGGRSWTLLDRGLFEPRVYAIEVVGREVILVGAGGVYRLDPLSSPIDEPRPPASSVPPFVSLNQLIGSSVSRRELNQSIGSRWVAAAVPQVQVEYVYQTLQGPDWANEDPAGTLFDYDGYWRIQARLTWSPNRQRNGTTFDAEDGEDIQVMVTDDDVAVDIDEAPQIGYSQVSRGSAKYRNSLTTQITELYRLRARLVMDAPPRDVLEATLRALRLAEVEATLDVYSAGAVSSWRADPFNNASAAR